MTQPTATRKDLYYIPWDVAEASALQEAQSHASSQYDLTKLEDRQRCYHAHLAQSYGGGLGLYCQDNDFDRNQFEAWAYRGEPQHENLKRQMVKQAAEFDQLAANDPFWALINVMGAKK